MYFFFVFGSLIAWIGEEESENKNMVKKKNIKVGPLGAKTNWGYATSCWLPVSLWEGGLSTRVMYASQKQKPKHKTYKGILGGPWKLELWILEIETIQPNK